MKNSKRKQLDARIYSEASDWLIEFRSGDIDASGRKEFCHWLRASPEHMRAYLELAAVWNEGSALDPKRTFDDAALAAALSEPDNVTSFPDRTADSRPKSHRTEQQIPGSSRLSTTKIRLLAVAASLLFAALGTGYWYLYVRNIYSTDVGEQRTLTLNDGSTVELNTGTTIRVVYTDRERHIDLLDGQALFHVAHDRAKPFIVHTKTTNIRAVGTQFDVYRKNAGTTVTVVEGRVAVYASTKLPGAPDERQGVTVTGEGDSRPPPEGSELSAQIPHTQSFSPSGKRGAASDQREPNSGASESTGHSTEEGRQSASSGELFLAAGEQATMDTHGTLARATEPNIAAATAWAQHQLVFKGASLQEVAGEFNRYNHRRLVIRDPTLGSLKITGIFSSTDPTALIHFLQARPSIIVTETSDQIVISLEP